MTDQYELLESLKTVPQTYKTILAELYGYTSASRSLRRKLNVLFRRGDVCRTLIPGTAFGKILFYVLDKTYTIFFVRYMLHVYVYYCDIYVEDSLYVYLKKPYLLQGSWVEFEDIKLDKENIIKVI